MDIKILGTGCANCDSLEKVTQSVAKELAIDAEFEKVTSPGEIASWGVMSTPALVIDDEVVLSGKVPTQAEVAALLKDR